MLLYTVAFILDHPVPGEPFRNIFHYPFLKNFTRRSE